MNAYISQFEKAVMDYKKRGKVSSFFLYSGIWIPFLACVWIFISGVSGKHDFGFPTFLSLMVMVELLILFFALESLVWKRFTFYSRGGFIYISNLIVFLSLGFAFLPAFFPFLREIEVYVSIAEIAGGVGLAGALFLFFYFFYLGTQTSTYSCTKCKYEFKLFEDFTPMTLGFLLKPPKDVLVLFAGAGLDMLNAYGYSQGKANITGVEINPLITEKAVSLPQFNLQTFFDKENWTR